MSENTVPVSGSAKKSVGTELTVESETVGIELPSAETSALAETGRLKIRQFCESDLNDLWAIMRKPEVMYAWESGFTKEETQEWLDRQYNRYNRDGYGYFAVILKESDRLIGQAGLMTNEIGGETVVEIGYIFDDAVWGQGYAIEAARACVDLAFDRFGLRRLYATIRPENMASVKLAEKLGMRKTGRYVKVYQGKEMTHDIFVLQNIREGSL